MRSLITLTALMATTTAAAADGMFTVVARGRDTACIVMAEGASQELQAAVAEMRTLVKQATGADLPVVAAAPQGRPAIHVGRTPLGRTMDLGNLDGDGFVIAFPDERTCVILGPTDWGTEFGVYEFLERYAGVRWLMPGPDGTHVPEQPDLLAPRQTVREEPAFFSRKYFGVKHPAQQLWARRNRLHSRVEFHHNVYRLFPPKTDREAHPEFFPIHHGKRDLPADNSVAHWQPCFTADGIVDEAAKRIIAYFDGHPEATSYSLGVNDSGGHCECDRCRALDPGRKNLLGKDHLSDRYFTWANAVVERVLKVHPGKTFGCLAYSEILEPPDDVKVHPAIIPYMTYDRMKWADPAFRGPGQELTRKWHAASPTLGWYDYIYGSIYCVPRVYPRQMAEYCQFAHANGVRGLTAEAYPNFGEGPKLYVSLKLQWDPTLSVDQLLDEWYRLTVGEKAAPYIARYYAHWEDFWTRRALKSDWWRLRPEGQYLPFLSPGYLEEVTPAEIQQCRTWLEAAVANTATAPQRARAQLLLQAFEYYEASALAYPHGGLTAAPPQTEAEALRTLEELARESDMPAKRRHLANEVFEGHPFLQFGTPIDRYPEVVGHAWGASRLWTIVGWLDRSQPVRNRVQELARTAPSNAQLQARAMLLATGTGRSLLQNDSFELGDHNPATGWQHWLQANVGSLQVTDQDAATGKRSVRGQGIQYGGPHQTIPFTPGIYAVTCRVRLPRPVAGHIEVTIRAVSAKGRNLPPAATARFTPTPGDWVTLGTLADLRNVPEAASIRTGIWARSHAPDDVIYFDDIRLLRLPD